MNNKSDITFMMGSAYITLALISIFVDIPIKATNSVAIGAVCFSVSEFLNILINRKIKKRSFVEILKDPKLKDKGSMAFGYITEILCEKQSEFSAQKSVLFFLSIFFKMLALFCVIIYPLIPSLPSFVETSKFGVFCTVISMGIIFISFYFSNRIEDDKNFNDFIEVMNCYDVVLDEHSGLMKELANAYSGTRQKNLTKEKRSKKKTKI